MPLFATRFHGIIDYIYGILLISLPFILGTFILGFPGGAAQWTMAAAGVFVIIYSLLTDYEASAIRVIPMPVHLLLDIATGVFLIASPWLFGFADAVWQPHVLFGAIAIIAPLLSSVRPSYSAAESQRSPEAPRNRAEDKAFHRKR